MIRRRLQAGQLPPWQEPAGYWDFAGELLVLYDALEKKSGRGFPAAAAAPTNPSFRDIQLKIERFDFSRISRKII
jgi:hypothetical protein